MKQDFNLITNGLLNYFGLESLEEFRSLNIDEKLINKVGLYLSESNIKFNISNIAQLLGINRASIYNTYPQSAEYLQALIAQQKAIISQKKSNKKPKTKKNTDPKEALKSLDKESIEKFMSIIMSLEFQKKTQEKQISKLKSTIASLQSELSQYKKMY